jgi:outer membrane murein-binding lipoprotein Lpp
MMLARLSQALDQLAQQVPAASSGLSKAKQGINEAMSAIVTQPRPEGAQQTPPY